MNNMFIETIKSFFDREEAANRRSHARQPFIRPVVIELSGGTTLAGCTRDISRSGVGLLHPVPLDAGPISLTIEFVTGDWIRVPAEVVWCHPVRPNQFSSGGKFLEDLIL
jgi:hypothetical protein